MKTSFALAACALLAFGCSPQTPRLSVSLVNVKFEEMTALETTATFTLRLNNETPAPMRFTGGAHKIYINGLYVGSGLSSESVEVPRLASVTQQITVHLSNLALATRIKAVIESRSFDYCIRSVFYGQSRWSKLRCVNEGRLDLKDFLPTPEPEQTNAPAVAPAQQTSPEKPPAVGP